MRARTLVYVLVVAGLVAVGCRAAAPSVPLPPATPFAPEVMAEVHEVRDLAAQARGLEPADNITEGTITRDQLKSYYDEVADVAHESDSDGELAVMNTALRLMQMLEPGEDAIQEYTSDLGTDVIGFYSLEDDALVMVDDGGSDSSLDLYDGLALAHEYVHSFQDASFDFDRLGDLQEKEEEDRLNTEYSVTIDALMEGDAQAASIGYLGLSLGADAVDEWLDNGVAEASIQDDGSGSALDRMAIFPYSEGLRFVLYLWLKGGWEEVDKAYADPPKTTEQIMHPDRYVAGDEPLGLKLQDLSDGLGDGWRQTDDGVFGEFDVYNYIRTGTDDDLNARSVADGWNGGRMAIYAYGSDSERVVLHLVLSWDNDDEANEFYNAFQLHVQSLGDAQHAPLLWSSQDMQTQRLLWDGESEHIYGWMEDRVFRAVFTVQQSDLEQAMSAVAPGVTREAMLADIE